MLDGRLIAAPTVRIRRYLPRADRDVRPYEQLLGVRRITVRPYER